MRRATLFINPGAGRRARARRQAIEELLAPHLDLDIHEVGGGAAVRAAVAETLRDRPDVVVGCGGDGTISELAGALARTGVPLGIIPGGTANSVARALGIPLDVEGACRLLVEGEARTIDTALISARRARPRTMVLMATVGMHAETIGGTAREAKRRWGVWAYFAHAASMLARYGPFRVELESDDGVVQTEATAVTVANVAPPTAVWAQGPAAVRPDDGLLDVTVVATHSLAEGIATGAHLYRTATRGEPATRENVGYFRCRRLRLTASPRQRLLVDGDFAGRTPLEVVCQPGSLRIVAPPVHLDDADTDDVRPVASP